MRFRIHGTEGQRRLAGTGHPGEDHQGIARQVHVDLPEVVLASAAHSYAAVVVIKRLGWRRGGYGHDLSLLEIGGNGIRFT
ncbi:hypothetical protein GCM10027285_27990 [Oleiagrimonas citrea]